MSISYQKKNKKKTEKKQNKTKQTKATSSVRNVLGNFDSIKQNIKFCCLLKTGI